MLTVCCLDLGGVTKVLLAHGLLSGAEGERRPKTPLSAPFHERMSLRRKSPPRSKFSRKVHAIKLGQRITQAWEGTENKSVKFQDPPASKELQAPASPPRSVSPRKEQGGEGRLPELDMASSSPGDAVRGASRAGGGRGDHQRVPLRGTKGIGVAGGAQGRALRRGQVGVQMPPMWLPVAGGFSSGSDNEGSGGEGPAYLGRRGGAHRPGSVPSVGAAFMPTQAGSTVFAPTRAESSVRV